MIKKTVDIFMKTVNRFFGLLNTHYPIFAPLTRKFIDL